MNKETRNIQVIKDLDGKSIVMINDIIFKDKRHIVWKDVENYLKKYIGEFYEVAETKDIVYIGSDLPDEYTSSIYTYKLKGALPKVKANLAQALPEAIKNSTNKRFLKNKKEKNCEIAKYGWYRYDIKFGLPTYNDFNELVKFNIYVATLVIRINKDKKLFLYDIINIKKRNELPA